MRRLELDLPYPYLVSHFIRVSCSGYLVAKAKVGGLRDKSLGTWRSCGRAALAKARKPTTRFDVVPAF